MTMTTRQTDWTATIVENVGDAPVALLLFEVRSDEGVTFRWRKAKTGADTEVSAASENQAISDAKTVWAAWQIEVITYWSRLRDFWKQMDDLALAGPNSVATLYGFEVRHAAKVGTPGNYEFKVMDPSTERGYFMGNIVSVFDRWFGHAGTLR